MNGELLAHFFGIVPVGFLSGLLAGAFGVGGGVIAVPVVHSVLGIEPHVAVGSTLGMILPTALIAVFNYRKQQSLSAPLSIAVSLPAVFASIAASALSDMVPGRELMLMLAALMVLVGLDFVTGLGNKLKSKSPELSDNESCEFTMKKENILTAASVGVSVGVLSGLLGIGGGFVMVPAFCYFLNLPLKAAFGTSLLVVALVSLPGTIVHALNGHVRPDLVLALLIGSLPGAWLGSYFSLKAKDRLLRIIFGAILLVLAVLFAYQELR